MPDNFLSAMKSTSGKEKSLFGWVAYAVLALMLGLPLLDWLVRAGFNTASVLMGLSLACVCLLRPLFALGLWLGLVL